ncbi:globin [Malikia spinosa]|uniref:Globin n=1 Tax=Malikia spinosa TaxID=86180 RepID=A0A2S9KEI1_9BURK|nr:group II truncated hemoglobin [Malikia spinosa]OGB71571.1 MAG: globin [Burkholderiales bacterium RIFOXYC12_FULL_65_23]PRD68861.1 globin [Malikia spinosa]
MANLAYQPAYELIGGAPALRQLVNRFYELMDELPEAYTVRKIHPESLVGSAQSLFEFLSGWFGGPPLYSNKKGHPRLRMRHAPYAVGPIERDEWMLCMRMALTEQVGDAELRDALIETFQKMADHMVNTDGSPNCSHHSHAHA